MQEELGVGSGTGVFTQSGGVNMYAIQLWDKYTTLHHGAAWLPAGGYGEYDLNGGHLNAIGLFVGGNNGQGTSSLLNSGTGVFNQTGGSVGSFGSPAAATMPSAWWWAAISPKERQVEDARHRFGRRDLHPRQRGRLGLAVALVGGCRGRRC